MTAGWEQPQSEPSQCHLHPGTHAAPQPEAGKTDKDRGQREGSVSWCSRQGQSRDLPPSWGDEGPQPQRSGVDGTAGTASSQLPHAVVQLRGDSAGPHSSVQLWFQQLIF